LQSIFTEIFQRQENEVKECGLKTVNNDRASNFPAGGPEFLATPLYYSFFWKRIDWQSTASKTSDRYVSWQI